MNKYTKKYHANFLNVIKNYNVSIINVTNDEGNVHFINSFKIYVINLKSNIIRRNYIEELFKKMEINYSLIIVEKIDKSIIIDVEFSLSTLGCLLSHLWCLQDIIRNRHAKNIIFEDDVIFHKNFKEMFYELFHRKDITYDLLLLGACDFDFSRHNYKNVTNGLYTLTDESTCTHTYGAHANYYSLKGAESMFNRHMKLSKISFFDNTYYNVFSKLKNTAFICSPNLVVSELSTTNLNHLYPFFTEREINYYSSCFIDFQFTDYHFVYLCFLECPGETYEDKIVNYFKGDMEKVCKIKERLNIDVLKMII
jgi:GR25 family glycosyltransferase involved in LPS biosynthesis